MNFDIFNQFNRYLYVNILIQKELPLRFNVFFLQLLIKIEINVMKYILIFASKISE